MELTTTTDALAKFCARATHFDFVSVDTEFLRETTYWPKLCLLQAATPDEAILVDPLADGLSLQPFFELLANRKIVKVFHAARQDIAIFVKLQQQVTETHRWDWVEDELQVLRSIDTYVVKPENAWERFKSKLSRPRDLAALKVIAAWRERRAQDTDQPRSRLLKDDALIELAMQRPVTPEAFDKLRAVQRGYGRSSAAQELIAIIKDVEALSKDQLPPAPDRYRGPSPK